MDDVETKREQIKFGGDDYGDLVTIDCWSGPPDLDLHDRSGGEYCRAPKWHGESDA